MKESAGRSEVLNVGGYLANSRVVGPGVRDAIWVQGCTIGCAGCANREYLPTVPRYLLPVGRLLDHLASRQGAIDGISLLGGEPTEQPGAVVALLRGVRRLGLSSVVFSGRTFESLGADVRTRSILQNADLLIDGPFIRSQADDTLFWRGSKNQRIIPLSGRFSAGELDRTVNAEIVVSASRVVVNGIGWREQLPETMFYDADRYS